MNAPVLTVEEARRRILERVQRLPPVELPLREALGCVLARDAVTERDIPPFPSSAMDGFAVRADDIGESPTKLPIVGRALIGHPPEADVGSGEAVEIATGAPIPKGADCVIPIEDCQLDGESVVALKAPGAGAHVRPAGQDARAGDVIVPAGRRLTGPALGMLSAAGQGAALVYPRVRVAVVSTGDELVEPGQPVKYGQIGDSNSYTLLGGLHEAGALPELVGIIRDDEAKLTEAFTSALAGADCVISSGGVSAGVRDKVKQVLASFGTIESYRVAMQPGMPQAFGLVQDKPFFGLPGNPVSVFVSFELFIRPALLRMMGRQDIDRRELQAVLAVDITGPPNKTRFVRVAVSRQDGAWRAQPTGPPASNLLGTVVRANGLAVIPPGAPERATIKAGEQVRVQVFGALEERS